MDNTINPPIKTAEFRNPKHKPRILWFFNDHILIYNKKKLIPLTFETKFSIIRLEPNDKRGLGRPIGIHLEGVRLRKFMSDQIEQIIGFKDYLAQRINQRDFHQSFKAQKRIGKGNFASVYLADRLEDEQQFAIKAFNKEGLNKQDKGHESIKNEIRIMRQLDNPGLIKLHEVYETQNSIYMVLDLLEGGSLYEKIKQRTQFTSHEIETIMQVLLKALISMHSKRIMHRDLKPENILFRKPNQLCTVCIADFGLATNADDQQYLFSRCGTPGFVAPEVINYKDGKYEPVCDIFSLGLIFYILLTGKAAFPGKNFDEILLNNRRCEIDFNLENVPYYALDLLKRMLEIDPKKRITAQQSLDHPYFDKTQSKEDDLEERLRFDSIRKVDMNSPFFGATPKMRGNQDDLVMNTPLITGNTNSIQNSPTNTGFNSPSIQPREIQKIDLKPSIFKLNGNSQHGTPKQVRGPDPNLFKIAIQNDIAKKLDQGKINYQIFPQVKNVKECLSKNI